MALAATTIFEVRNGGSDTANGGAFDPGQTAGMFTDGAATSATGNSPVFTSASYNFVAGDVGAWLYIASGTNWTAGWYQIASVASNAATLSAAIGAAYLATSSKPTAANTVAGCATTASPTGATWSIDYSQQTAAQVSYTDLASAGTGLTVSSSAHPFGKQQVGNALIVASGTNFNAGVYVIASVSGTTATVVGAGNITTGAGSSGVGGLGGCFASLGKAAGFRVTGNAMFLKYNATPFNISSTSSNVAGGIINDTATGSDTVVDYWIGWDTVRTINVLNPTNKPTLQIDSGGGVTNVSVLKIAPGGGVCTAIVRNVIIDGNSKTGIRGFELAGVNGEVTVEWCRGINCTNTAFYGASGPAICKFCYATGCSTQAAFVAGAGTTTFYACVARSNTITGFSFAAGVSGSAALFCISDSNSGASSDGFNITAGSLAGRWWYCTSTNNGRDGFRNSSANARGSESIVCVAYGNAGSQFNRASTSPMFNYYCACVSGGESSITGSVGLVTLTADPFTNSSGGDFSLNSTAGGGAAVRAAGFPGAFPGISTTGYQDIGAVQSQGSGGGTTIAGTPMMRGMVS